MNETPWPAPATLITSAADPSTSQPPAPATSRATTAVVAALIGTVVAIAVGVGVGVFVAGMSTRSCSTDPWCGLGAVIFGFLAGVASAIIAYVVAGLVTIFRARPAGDRAANVVLHHTIPVGIAALVIALAGVF